MSIKLIQRNHKRYGWKPDRPDARDYLYAAQRPEMLGRQLPSKTDLEPMMPPCYDQGRTSSCTANALAGNLEYLMNKNKCPMVIPSRLFIYWNERFIEDSVNQDSGAMIRDGVMTMKDQGCCSEELWPFSEKEADIFKKPSKEAYDSAAEHQITLALRLRTPRDMRACLASGYPFVMGMSVYESFENQEVATTGIMKMPLPTEQVLGGHAILVVGYDDETQRYKIRNSWGTDWGLSGYFFAPYGFVENPNYCSDFWSLRKTENANFNPGTCL